MRTAMSAGFNMATTSRPLSAWTGRTLYLRATSSGMALTASESMLWLPRSTIGTPVYRASTAASSLESTMPSLTSTRSMGLHDDTRELRDRMQVLEEETIDLMQQDPVPRAQVDSLLREISDLRLETVGRAIDKMTEAKAFLTPEQERMFFHAIQRAGHRGPPGRGFGNGRPGGPRRRPPPDQDRR